MPLPSVVVIISFSEVDDFNFGVCNMQPAPWSIGQFDNWFCTRTVYIKFPNSVDPDEVAHNEPPELDLPCLPSVL